MSDSKAAGSAGLHMTLGLRDVTLLGLACIVGTRWLATAAHAGPGSVKAFSADWPFCVPLTQPVVKLITLPNAQLSKTYLLTYLFALGSLDPSRRTRCGLGQGEG